VRAKAIWEEVRKTAGDSVTALFERLDALTDPERVEDANMLEGWRRKYESEITVRTKWRWWRKLTGSVAAKLAGRRTA
jgi:type II secretory pathway component PulL